MLGSAIPLVAQISPGALSHAHQSLNGVTGCATCHEISTGNPNFKCLDCHGEIASRVNARKGLHATYVTRGTRSKCATCHSEHNGEDFTLIKWDVKTFDHRQTGYALEGKHLALNCNQCHNAGRVSATERPSIKIQDLNRTFLGVSPSCITCHEDRHQGRLGADCLQCHNYEQWKTIRVGKFDHAKTRYPLTGLHVEVACKQCHAPGRDGQPIYRGIRFGSCADCHSDPHRGGFEQTCQSCHNTAGWKRVTAAALDFDHAQTKFPLLGKHAEVECMQCHAGGDFNKPLAFQKCIDCHQPSPHGAQFSKRPDGGECASCHTVTGFRPSTFGLKEHARTAYPLVGKHAVLDCAECHVPNGSVKDTLYKIKFQRCTDCHRDEHAGQFAGPPYLNACESCHSLQRLQPSTFTLARHKATKFPLTGSHMAVACNECHRISAEFKPKPAALYHWGNLACTTCHADPHKGQFNKFLRQASGSAKIAGCDFCHSADSWREFSRFDHAKTSFSLLGAHQTAACRDCHSPALPKAASMAADFKTAPTKCESCHADVHGSQFARGGATPCAECHDSRQWKPSLFDHDKRTSFALQGAHRGVRCEGCHKLTRFVSGKSVLFYKPVPEACVACHGANVPKSNAPKLDAPKRSAALQ